MIASILKALKQADKLYGNDHGESMLTISEWAELEREAKQQLIRIQVNATTPDGLLHPTIANVLRPFITSNTTGQRSAAQGDDHAKA